MTVRRETRSTRAADGCDIDALTALVRYFVPSSFQRFSFGRDARCRRHSTLDVKNADRRKKKPAYNIIRKSDRAYNSQSDVSSEPGTAPAPACPRAQTQTEIHPQVSCLTIIAHFFPTAAVRLVSLISLRRSYGVSVKIAGDKPVFVFLLLFPRRYRSGFTTR